MIQPKPIKDKPNWYWLDQDLLITPKGNWRKSPDGVYVDRVKNRDEEGHATHE